MQPSARYTNVTLKKIAALVMAQVPKTSTTELNPTLELQTRKEFTGKVQRQVDIKKEKEVEGD